MLCDLTARGVAAVAEGQSALPLGGRAGGGGGGCWCCAVCHGLLLVFLFVWMVFERWRGEIFMSASRCVRLASSLC